MKKLVPFSISLLILILAGACASVRPVAVATLAPTSGSTASGTVTFTQMRDGSVTVAVKLAGVPPGIHGFHVHQNGDCGDNGNAAGGHFNPTNAPHGAPSDVSHHAGDFGNVEADANGKVDESRTLHGITVEAGANSVVGHAVILHANADDLKSQPSGNAGARIACGVVQMKP